MKKIFLTGIAIALFILCDGCVLQTPINSTSTPSLSVPSLSVETLPSTTSTPAPTQSGSTETFSTKCLEIDQTDTKKYELDGTVFLNNREMNNGKYTPGVIKINLRDQQRDQIQKENERLLDIKQSPDRTRIAYHYLKAGDNLGALVIVKSDLEKEMSINWKEEWDIVLQWLDDSHILIRKTAIDSNEHSKPPEIIIFDINAQTESIIKPEFPDIYDIPILSWWDGFSGAAYNSDFTSAVYMHWNSDLTYYDFALWDMKKNNIVTTQSVVGFPVPKWSPTGSQFITTGLIELDPRELFSINKDGQIKQLSHLSNHDANTEILDYSWSPNEEYIALLLRQNKTTAKIAMLDTNTLTVTDYCIPITLSGDDFGQISSPIWSPDSQQLIIQDWYTKNHRKVILIDVVKNYAVQIAEDLEPVAWVKNP